MTDHSNTAALAEIRWADAELQRVTVDYDAVVLRVRESDGKVRTLRAEGHIGYSLVGFWDEVIIVRAELSHTHPGLDASGESLQRRPGAGFVVDAAAVERARRRIRGAERADDVGQALADEPLVAVDALPGLDGEGPGHGHRPGPPGSSGRGGWSCRRPA